MAQDAMEQGGAIAGKGTLWAKEDNEGKNTISFKKAFFFAVWVEVAMIVAFASIDFEKRWDDIKNSKIMKAVTLEPPPDLKKEEPPPPPPPKQPKPPEKPKENVKEAAPILVDAPVATSGSASSVSVPQAVGDVSQGKGEMTEAPQVTAPRTIASITNLRNCVAALNAGYPREALRIGQTGSLTALVTVGPNGRALRVDITEANPRRVFDRALASGLMSEACKFAVDPVGYQALIPFTYKLAGEVAE